MFREKFITTGVQGNLLEAIAGIGDIYGECIYGGFPIRGIFYVS